jgi:uncharacterized membrane protein YfcA
MKVVILGIFIGLAAGLVGALCGVGGGIFMVPMFRQFLQLTQKQAVATSLAVIVFTGIAATISNVRSGQSLVQWPLFAAAACSSVVAAFLMAERMREMADETLTRIFAVLMIGVGFWMWFFPSGVKPASPQAPVAGRETPPVS